MICTSPNRTRHRLTSTRHRRFRSFGRVAAALALCAAIAACGSDDSSTEVDEADPSASEAADSSGSTESGATEDGSTTADDAAASSDSSTGSAAETEEESGNDSETDSDTESGNDSETDSDTDADNNTESGNDTEADADTEADSDNEGSTGGDVTDAGAAVAGGEDDSGDAADVGESADSAAPTAQQLLPGTFEPASLVTLDPLLYQAALALGVAPVGTSTFETAGGGGGPLPAYLPEDVIADAELFGTILAPNLEAIAAADPELVLGIAQFAPSVSTELVGPEVALFDGAFSDWRGALAFVGEQLGRADVAAELVEQIDGRLASLADGDERTGSIVRFTGPDILTINETAIGGEKLVQAGFTIPDDLASLSPQLTLSLEQIELFDTDVIVVVQQDENDTVSGPDRFEEWSASPLWEGLPAVQNDDVAFVGPCWATPTAWCAAVVTDDIEEIAR